MPSQNFTVTGMTCEHCVRAVTAEFSGLPGVTAVGVDLATGAVTVHSACACDARSASATASKRFTASRLGM